jgi:hypothetical protein
MFWVLRLRSVEIWFAQLAYCGQRFRLVIDIGLEHDASGTTDNEQH